MATYVISDIHGEYDQFTELLEKIDLQDKDTLYILGDVLDRGPYPIKVLLKLMDMPNVIPIAGNHEVMALECLEFLSQEITETSIADLDENIIGKILTWQRNGSKSTTDEFYKLDLQMRKKVMDYLKEFTVYEDIEINGKKYLLVHGGLGSYSPEKAIEEYSLNELVWTRTDYETQYFDDIKVITGHTPTQNIEYNNKPGYIYKKNNNIAIDCGACFKNGRLAAICLETGEEFYSSGKN